jgi:exopolyphosphatase/guanosine-5'-triphosphate,3'-diphosphate pyrophosphatase
MIKRSKGGICLLNFDERIVKYAIVDIGANSIRMNIYDIDTQTGEFSVCASARSLLGLAAYAKNGTLSNDGAGKLFAVLREFLARANSIPCDRFSAFATASLRGLSNSKRILRDVKAGLGIDIEIISGEAEAGYDHAAIRYRFPEAKRGILIDMGGGSTEIVHFEKDLVVNAVSLPIGCVMLGKSFTSCTKKDPFPTEGEMERIRAYVKTILSAYPCFKALGGTAFLIGGTARAAAKLSLSEHEALFDGYSFTSDKLKKTADTAFCDIRRGGNLIRETVPDRITSIIPGLVAYLEICEYMSLSDFIISNAGVREGYLIDYIQKNFLRKTQEF